MATETPTGSIFLSLGNGLQDMFDTFARTVVNSFVADVLALLPAGLFLYFLVKGWLIMSGRSKDAFPDLIMNVGIMALIITLGISTIYTFELANGVVMWLESFLVSHMPEFPDTAETEALLTSPWNWLDLEWNKFSTGLDGVTAAIDQIPWDSPGLGMASALSWFVAYAGGAWFFFSITSIFVLNKIVITILIAFTPVFMALCIFPLTREFLQNWFKTLLAYTLALILVLVLGALFMHIFDGYSNNIQDALKLLEDGNAQGAWNMVNEALFVITMMSVIMSFVLRQIPAMAQGLIGRFIGAGGIVSASTVITQARNDTMSVVNAANTARNVAMAPYAAFSYLGNEGKRLGQYTKDVINNANKGGIEGLRAAMGLGKTAGVNNTSGMKPAQPMSTFTANKPGQTSVSGTASGGTQFSSTGQKGYDLNQGSINLGQTSHSGFGGNTPKGGPGGSPAKQGGSTNQPTIPQGAYHAKYVPGSLRKAGSSEANAAQNAAVNAANGVTGAAVAGAAAAAVGAAAAAAMNALNTGSAGATQTPGMTGTANPAQGSAPASGSAGGAAAAAAANALNAGSAPAAQAPGMTGASNPAQASAPASGTATSTATGAAAAAAMGALNTGSAGATQAPGMTGTANPAQGSAPASGTAGGAAAAAMNALNTGAAPSAQAPGMTQAPNASPASAHNPTNAGSQAVDALNNGGTRPPVQGLNPNSNK